MEPILSTLNSRALLGAAALLTLAAGSAGAQTYEQPPSTSPAAVLGGAARGVNYVVLSPVESDGALWHYRVHSSYGDFTTIGGELMRARIKELNALAALEKTSSAQKFGEAAVKEGLSPVIFAGSLIAHPVNTTQNTVAGAGEFFGSLKSGFNNMGKSREDAVASISGASQQKRQIAAQLGVDPYTDFRPLSDKLDRLAGAAAVGNLAASGVLILAPGAAAIVAGDAATANTLTGMAKDYSSAQLMDLNRARLAKLGVDRATADRLLTNMNYTPIDVTAMTNALSVIGPVANLNAMIARAATADNRDLAYFIRRRVELTAAYERRDNPIVSFLRSDDIMFPACLTRAGGIVGGYPIDRLSWTPQIAAAFDAMKSQADGDAAVKSLVITGTATPMAKKALAARGWKVTERAKSL